MSQPSLCLQLSRGQTNCNCQGSMGTSRKGVPQTLVPSPVVVFCPLGVILYPSPAALVLLAVIVISYPSLSVTRRYLYPSLVVVVVICCPSLSESESISCRHLSSVILIRMTAAVIRFNAIRCSLVIILFLSVCRRSLLVTRYARPRLFTRRYLSSVAIHYPLPVTPIRYSCPFDYNYSLGKNETHNKIDCKKRIVTSEL